MNIVKTSLPVAKGRFLKDEGRMRFAWSCFWLFLAAQAEAPKKSKFQTAITPVRMHPCTKLPGSPGRPESRL
jgi:hypothetical protein